MLRAALLDLDFLSSLTSKTKHVLKTLDGTLPPFSEPGTAAVGAATEFPNFENLVR